MGEDERNVMPNNIDSDDSESTDTTEECPSFRHIIGPFVLRQW